MNTKKSSANQAYLLSFERRLVEVLQNESATNRIVRSKHCTDLSHPDCYPWPSIGTKDHGHSFHLPCIFRKQYFSKIGASHRDAQEAELSAVVLGFSLRTGFQLAYWVSAYVLGFSLRAGFQLACWVSAYVLGFSLRTGS